MSSFKIVGRITENTTSWYGTRKVGRQGKKRVYVTREDYEKYSPETAKRWSKFCGLDVEAYEMVDGKWKRCKSL